MKNLFSFISIASFWLFFALPVNAQIKLCPTGSQFEKLCTGLGADTFSGIVYTGIVILLIVATLLSLFFLIWGGIKWILSGGDKAGVEGARNTIVASVIGLVVTFLSFFILVVVGQIFNVNLLQLQLPQVFK